MAGSRHGQAATDSANGIESYYWQGGNSVNPDFRWIWEHYRHQVGSRFRDRPHTRKPACGAHLPSPASSDEFTFDGSFRNAPFDRAPRRLCDV